MLIDTSAWLIIFDNASSQHAFAMTEYDRARRRITHSYVVVELISLALSRRHSISKILDFVFDILHDSEVEVLWIDELITHQALALLSERRDKAWSLCDAVSFVLMRQIGITEALTTDHHFEQAGFIKLLES
jgi:predicted nucleic acid-binding protein